MLTTKDQILITLLQCGTGDLYILDNIGYDVDDIIEEMIQQGNTHLHCLISGIFYKGAEDLSKALEENRDDIIETLEDKIADYQETMTREQLADCTEYIELTTDLELIDKLNPRDDYEYTLNFTDSHIFIPHLDWYERYLPEETAEIERQMGFYFMQGIEK